MAGPFEWLIVEGAGVDAGSVGLLRSLLTNREVFLPPGATAMVAVPLAGAKLSDSWSQRTLLDGIEYTFLFQWNARAGAWFISLFDDEDEPLFQSKKLVIERDFLHGTVNASRPSGSLILYEVSGALVEAGRDSLDVTHELCYVT